MEKYDLIEKAKNVHGDKFDYSLVDYINNYTKVKIICRKHGVFEQKPSNHIFSKRGCSKCAGKNKTNEELILELKEIQGDKYDYSLVNYINNDTKVKIICRKHGVFEQHFYSHRRGYGCPKCSKCKKSTTKEFIKKAKKIHGDKYDYSLVDYVNSDIKVKIICPKHGIFEQLSSNHYLSKHGCPECYKVDQESFIKRSNIIHDNKYNYSSVNFVNLDSKVKIICPKHGIFEQTPSCHLGDRGCPMCHESKGEEFIRKILINRFINFERQKKFEKCKNKNSLPFDFYLPDYNLCIEFNGEQHYKPNSYFGGIKTFEYIQKNDNIKIIFCKNNKIKLLIIRFDENIIEKLNEI